MKNVDDIRKRCELIIASGLDFVQLVVPRKSRPRSNICRVWSGGPKGRFVGEVRHGEWLVDISAADVLRALDKLERKSV